MSFTGFSSSALRFWEDIIHNNNKEWFTDNKTVFQKEVQEPALKFVVSLGECLKEISPEIYYDTKLNGSGSVMRIYRDTRFSADKSPYKTNLGLLWWYGQTDGKKTERPCFHFWLDAQGARMMAGIYRFDKPHLDAYRAAVVDEKRGAELASITQKMESSGYSLGEPAYKKAPRGFEADHPRAELLRRDGLGVQSSIISWDDVQTPKVVDICLEHSRQMAPLVMWMHPLI